MSDVEKRSMAIRPIFLSTFETACKAATKWPKNAHGTDIVLSFNLPVIILDRGLCKAIVDILDKIGIPYHRVQFELLERGKLSRNEVAKQSLNTLRRLGIAFFLDDAGEKSANFEVIHEYEKYLCGYKIGTSFTLDMTEDLVKRGLVRSLLYMASELDKAVVVEGIETYEALKLVAPFVPPYVQGFLLHRPEPDGPALHTQMATLSQICCSLPLQLLHTNQGHTSVIDISQ